MEDSYVLQLLKPKFKDFHLCFCGFAECKPLHSYGPAARPNYILHYVMKGKGIYQVGETKYQLKEGQAFLIEPESLTFYQADKMDPWSYLWVGFGGTEAQRFVRDLGLNSRQLTCECEYGEELKEIVFEMLHHTCSTAENLYYLQGKLYQFFSVLARGIEIQQYADDTKDFLTEFRISRGKEQLTLTDLSVEEIAVSCGYRNSLAFGKVFKQKIGMTPTQYRNDNRKVARERLISVQNELKEYKKHKKIYVGEGEKE
jgi:AraC-like DNA-binding protein